MHDQPRAGCSSLPERREAAAVLLDILIAQHPAMLATDELVRPFAGGKLEPCEASLIVSDGLTEPLASGLMHRLGALCFPSRSALRARELFE